MEQRITRAPRIFGGILMFLGALVYLVDLFDLGRNLHMFVFPAVLLMGLGALFTIVGSIQERPTADSAPRSVRRS
jgi:hypothetical protein